MIYWIILGMVVGGACTAAGFLLGRDGLDGLWSAWVQAGEEDE